MKYNEVIEINTVTDLTAEPVTLDELKRHLNMLFDTPGSYDFGDDDSYLSTVLTAARMAMENYTGLSFAEKSLQAALRNQLGDIEIPMGPVNAISEVKDCAGTVLNSGSDYKTSGLKFLKLQFPFSDYLVVSYTAGYDTGALPEQLKRAVLEEAAYRYKNRGEQGVERIDFRPGICEGAMEAAIPYKRTSFIA